jgi:hypothetical protein
LLARAKVYTRGEKRKKKFQQKRGSGYFRLKVKKKIVLKGMHSQRTKDKPFSLMVATKQPWPTSRRMKGEGDFTSLFRDW